MERCSLRTFFALVILFTTYSTAINAADETTKNLSFAIGPQQSTGELARRWVPIMEYLSKRTGYSIHFTTTKDIPTYQREMREGKFDIAYINPYHYTLFRRAAGYDAFAQEKDANLTGVVVVGKNSDIKDMSALNGKELAFPAPGALTATILPMMYFKEHGIAVTPHYVTSHESVYRAVAKGLYPAGGGEQRTFDNTDPAIRDQLRVLWTAPQLPPFLFAAHPRVPKAAVERVRAAMLAMEQDPEAKPLLKAINFKGIAPAKDADYDAVRKLNIKIPE